MAKDSTAAFCVADAIERLWTAGKADPSIREITAESVKDMPTTAPLMQIVRNQIGSAIRILAEMGSLSHPVTAFYYKLPVRNRARVIPPDSVNRRRCVPTAAGARGTAGVRKVESTDDPLLLEMLGQNNVMLAGSVRAFEKQQQQAQQSGLLTAPVADVRDPAWFDQALLGANPQLSLPMGGGSTEG
jgi:hypothetical protein